MSVFPARRANFHNLNTTNTASGGTALQAVVIFLKKFI